MMNMAKLGTVSRAGNSFQPGGKRHKQRAGGLMRYTLCVIGEAGTWYGFRNGFGILAGFQPRPLSEERQKLQCSTRTESSGRTSNPNKKISFLLHNFKPIYCRL